MQSFGRHGDDPHGRTRCKACENAASKASKTKKRQRQRVDAEIAVVEAEVETLRTSQLREEMAKYTLEQHQKVADMLGIDIEQRPRSIDKELAQSIVILLRLVFPDV